MTVTEEEQKALQDLQASLEKLVAVTADSLIQTSRLGTALDFSNGKAVFERTLNLFARVKETDLTGIPAQIITGLKNQADSAFQVFDQILKFDANSQNPGSQRDSLIQNVQNQYNGHFQVVSPIISYCEKRGFDFEQLAKDAREAVAAIKSQKEEFDQRGASMLADVQATLEKVRRAAAEVGVAQHSIHFKEEASSHLKNSRIWLGACILMVVVTVLYGGYCLFYLTEKAANYGSAESVQMFVAKLMLFSVLYYGIMWTGRMYRAVLHNYVVNKHRQNALSTFETFVKAAGDDAETKNAVLLQATQSIFSAQNSGFATNETENSSPTQVLEIIRGIPKQ